jgi:hypothetical protein
MNMTEDGYNYSTALVFRVKPEFEGDEMPLALEPGLHESVYGSYAEPPVITAVESNPLSPRPGLLRKHVAACRGTCIWRAVTASES